MAEISEEQKERLRKVVLNHKREMFQNSKFQNVESEAVAAMFLQAKIRNLSFDVEEPISYFKMGETFAELLSEKNLHMQFVAFPDDCWNVMHKMEDEGMFRVVDNGDEGVSFVIDKESTLGQVIGEALERIAGEV